ncbi:MAG: hypothetical protein GOVbin1709_22 [Prokaryotic dsDNA virus sp.]|nr:MAG: hypothetical protein GOVbin1709_22 [Prokaryotic dsDNA virus sp.]|tara:strand:+ start:4022 stop:4318 length:297 start_codon:yes stop_codon:yes gene_type:complete
MKIKNIDGIPLYSTQREARDHFAQYGITDYHVHYYINNRGRSANGYMPGKSHEDILKQIQRLSLKYPEIITNTEIITNNISRSSTSGSGSGSSSGGGY